MIVAALTDERAGDLGHGANRGGGLGLGQRQRAPLVAQQHHPLLRRVLRRRDVLVKTRQLFSQNWPKFATIRLILSQNLPTSAEPTTSFGTCQYGWSSIGSCTAHKNTSRR